MNSSSRSNLNVQIVPIVQIIISLTLCLISDGSASVTCTRNEMTVTLEKETYHFFNASELRLRYASCRATENSTHFIISTPLNDCGTSLNETEHVLIFWNEVQANALIIDNVVTRSHNVKLPFSCRYSRKSLLTLGFTPQSIYFGQEGNAKLCFAVNIRGPFLESPGKLSGP